ncbi:NADH-quinone oxidoreductase subunit J [Alicyclobacillus kakegawensis]|uniref:NADH-quinone oxidoreductase subunit J n=1 Tax=Alicyclobacillus kakegawensis TaxID=392012 RepID=UPI00083160D7|nr:NADH-quinone oxidoreductase subunit J [Alicyclobacillus kakegawensis]
MSLHPALIAFFIIALAILSAAISFLTLRKVIYMALAIGAVFIGCAAVYILLGAPFVGIAQVLIYAGAITILIMFAIMLTNHEEMEPPFRWTLQNGASAAFCVLLAAALLWIIRSQAWPAQGGTDINHGRSNPAAIGLELFQHYTVAFELVSLLLVVALVGAVVLAQARKEDE